MLDFKQWLRRFGGTRRTARRQTTRRVGVEALEDRTVLSVIPISAAAPSLISESGGGGCGSAESANSPGRIALWSLMLIAISYSGQLFAILP